MRQIVCLSNRPWSTVPTRTQQLMVRMKQAAVLFFEPFLENGQNHWRRPGRKLRPNLIAYTLPPSSHPKHILYRRGQMRAIAYLQSKLDRHRFKEPLLWCDSPVGSEFLDAIAYRALVYDCNQEWGNLPKQWEENLATEADVIFAASPRLVKRLTVQNKNVTLLPNGCNYPMFAKRNIEKPPELAARKRPVFGYAGTIWPDLDLSPLFRTAQDHPDCSIVLVGETKENPKLQALLQLKNVFSFGFIPPFDLPDYVCNFDVCLSLIRRSQIENDVLSTQMFEYLSTGNPIVHMLPPNGGKLFPDVVYNACDPAEFSRFCAKAVEETDAWAETRRKNYGREASWSRRAEAVNQILEGIGAFGMSK